MAKSVEHMERMLDARRSKGPLAATVSRPLVQGTISDIEKMFTSEDDVDQPAPDKPARADPPLQGSGRRWSRKAYEAVQLRWLKALYKQNDYGAVYDLGLHPSGTHVFVPVSDIEQVGMGDRRRAVRFIYATHGLSPSIFILSPFAPQFEGLGYLIRYLVPSKLIAENEERRLANEDAIVTGWKNALRNARPIVDRKKYRIGTFAVRKVDVVQELRLFLESCPFAPESTVPNLRGTNPREYVVTQVEVLRQYIPYLMGNVKFLLNIENDEDLGD
ncbi:hypothetical protein ABEF95_002060 [Exophiala dermatitidis]